MQDRDDVGLLFLFFFYRVVRRVKEKGTEEEMKVKDKMGCPPVAVCGVCWVGSRFKHSVDTFDEDSEI